MTQMSQGITLLENSMELWSQVQNDPLLHEINEELTQKEQDFEQLEATMSTLVPAQRLARLHIVEIQQDDELSEN